MMREKLTIKSTTDKTIKEAFEQFLKIKKALNRAEDTIDYYRDCYKLFIEFYGDGRLCREIDEDTPIDFLLYIKETRPHLAQNTLATHMRGIRAIFKYFMKCGYIPTFTVPLPTIEETVKEVYTNEEIQMLIKKPKISGDCSFSTIRDWAMVCYFLGTGTCAELMRCAFSFSA